jgi:hypothetical protein
MIFLENNKLRKLQVIKNNLLRFINSLKINEMHQHVTIVNLMVQSILMILNQEF